MSQEFSFNLSTGRSARIKVSADTYEQAEAIARLAAVDYIDQRGGSIMSDELEVVQIHDADWVDWEVEPSKDGGYTITSGDD